MSRFQDVYMPLSIVGYPTRVSPTFSTQITQVDSGDEQANQRWAHPLRNIVLAEGVRNHDAFEDFKAHWLIMRGPAYTFPHRDPTDFASVDLTTVNVAPTLSGLDQLIGTGDGVTRSFQLVKNYASGSYTYLRSIYFPVVSSVLITVNGVDPETTSPVNNWSATREGGVVTFDSAPALGHAIRAGYLFDLQVRYESDETFQSIMQTLGVSGFADIPLREVRFCQD